jgi:hypothetical protein
MADPICRWNNPFVKNVRRLLDSLPKSIMPYKQAKEIANQNFGKKFFGTPHQLAAQLGLYYENEGVFYPRFLSQITDDQIFQYLRNWITKYTVPNPYTKIGFNNLKPLGIHSELCKLLIYRKTEISWELALEEIFGEVVGNQDILKNAINYSEVIEVDKKNILKLKPTIDWINLNEYIIDIPIDRYDKEAFFNLFRYELVNSRNEIENDFLDDLEKQLEALDVKDIETVKQAIVNLRIGQANFRNSLIFKTKKCLFTNITDEMLLTAGHIKPWREATNDERININNGILLTPTFDKLFDKFLISFNEEGDLIYAKKLEIIWEKLFPKVEQIKKTKIIITKENQYFLEFHRGKFNEINNSK